MGRFQEESKVGKLASTKKRAGRTELDPPFRIARSIVARWRPAAPDAKQASCAVTQIRNGPQEARRRECY